MSNDAVSSTGSDPLKAVADALDAAVKAAGDGADDARKMAEDAIPAAGQFLARAAYNACYAVSYGVVFPSVLIARTIPKDNALVNGLIDGAHAAMDMVVEMKTKPESDSKASV